MGSHATSRRRRWWLAAFVMVSACSKSEPAWRPSERPAPPQAAPAQLAAPVSVELGGQPQHVEVAGQRVFVADLRGLSIWQRDESGGLRAVATLPTPGAARDVAVESDVAYVADGESGLAIVDVGIPEVPRLVRRVDIPGGARFVRAGAPGLAIVGHAGSVCLLRRRAEAVTCTDLASAPAGAAWVGERLFVATKGVALIALDVESDSLRVAREDRSRRFVTALAAKGDVLYATHVDKRLEVLDARTVDVASVATLALDAQPDFVAPLGDDVLVSMTDAKESVLVDVSDATKPRVRAAIAARTISAALLAPDTAVVAHTVPGPAFRAAFPAPLRTTGLSIVSGLRDAPRVTSTVRGAALTRLETNGRLLVGSGEDGRVRVFAPTAEARAPELLFASDASRTFELAARCGARVVATSKSEGLCAVGPDARAPACTTTNGEAQSLAIDEAAAAVWVANDAAELHGFSCGGPASKDAGAPAPLPALRAIAPPSDGTRRWITSIAAEDGRAVGGDGLSAMLHVFRVRAPSFARAGAFPLQERPQDVTLHRGLALVAEPRFGLQIVDVRDVERPREIAWVPMNPGPVAVAVDAAEGERVLVALALGESGVSLWSWDRGASLREVARADTTGIASDVAFARGALWVADTTALLRFDLAGVSP